VCATLSPWLNANKTRDFPGTAAPSSRVTAIPQRTVRGYGTAMNIRVALAFLCTAAAPAWAQAPAPYPGKLIRIINPVAAGGNQDIISRAMADHLTRAFAQPVVVEVRASGSALIGTRFVKNAAPDGYTLLSISNTFVRAPATMDDAGYDPLKDFTAISRLAEVPLVLVVTPSLPVKTVADLIALAKSRPGELSSANSGPGSTGHVATEAFCRRAGIRMMHVSYKGAAPAVVDLVGGHVMLRFDQVSTSLPFIRSGKLRPLAVTTIQRSAVLPAVPTIAESGLPGFNDPTYNGLMAPAGTPRDIIERLRAEVVRGVADPTLHKRFLDMGIELRSSASSDEFAAFLKKQASEFAILAREAHIRAE
jgi:tripartite-type tricarboxylate transporter receptor subunit TctC